MQAFRITSQAQTRKNEKKKGGFKLKQWPAEGIF
jgi:hypothetical protein